MRNTPGYQRHAEQLPGGLGELRQLAARTALADQEALRESGAGVVLCAAQRQCVQRDDGARSRRGGPHEQRPLLQQLLLRSVLRWRPLLCMLQSKCQVSHQSMKVQWLRLSAFCDALRSDCSAA